MATLKSKAGTGFFRQKNKPKEDVDGLFDDDFVLFDDIDEMYAQLRGGRKLNNRAAFLDGLKAVHFRDVLMPIAGFFFLIIFIGVISHLIEDW